jgi:hypothetical protein
VTKPISVTGNESWKRIRDRVIIFSVTWFRVSDGA